MNDQTKRELIAAGKVVVGGVRVVSGLATALGHGLIGTYCRNHHMMTAASRIGKASVEGGTKMVQDGWRELKG